MHVRTGMLRHSYHDSPLYSTVAHLIQHIQYAPLRAEHPPPHYYYPARKCCVLTIFCCLATVY